jgi:Ferric reductase like transmembrane component
MNAHVLWYVTRGSGVVALLLLTAAVLLGIVSALRWRGERWPRFAVTNAHRNLTLLSIVFVVIHVVTTVMDSYAPITLFDGIFPFLSPYRTLWLGLGTVAFDLLLALVLTSLMRGRIPARLWRGVHWLAYASWPVALMHSLGTGSDARTGWLQALGVASLVAVALAVLARIALGGGLRPARIGGAVAAVAVPVAVLAWYQSGPLQRGWAKRAGTPTTILARKATTLAASTQQVSQVAAPSEPTSFTSPVSGSVSTSQDEQSLATVSISLKLGGGPKGAARIELRGIPSGGGVSMTASGVSFVPATTRSVYTGEIVSLAGTEVGAIVRDASGHRLDLRFALNIDPSTNHVSGRVTAA